MLHSKGLTSAAQFEDSLAEELGGLGQQIRKV